MVINPCGTDGLYCFVCPTILYSWIGHAHCFCACNLHKLMIKVNKKQPINLTNCKVLKLMNMVLVAGRQIKSPIHRYSIFKKNTFHEWILKIVNIAQKKKQIMIMKLGLSHTLLRLLTQSSARNIWLYNFGKHICNICGQQFRKVIFVWLTIFSVELSYKVADMQVQGHCQSSGCSWKKMVLDVIKHHEVITRLMVSRPKVWL
jgi:hypothetical protein